MADRQPSFDTVALLVQIAGLTNENQQLKLEIQRLKQQLEGAVEHFSREQSLFRQELFAAQANASHSQAQGLSASLTGHFQPFSRKRQVDMNDSQLSNVKRHQREAASSSNDNDDHTMA